MIFKNDLKEWLDRAEPSEHAMRNAISGGDGSIRTKPGTPVYPNLMRFAAIACAFAILLGGVAALYWVMQSPFDPMPISGDDLQTDGFQTDDFQTDDVPEESADLTGDHSSTEPTTEPTDTDDATEYPSVSDESFPPIESTPMPEDSHEPSPLPEPSDPTEPSGHENTAPTRVVEMAFFDVASDHKYVKIGIDGFFVRFYGDFSDIDPNDFTNIVLTRDLIPIDATYTYVGFTQHFTQYNEEISEFYFRFDTPLIEPGRYGLSGDYDGVAFVIYDKIIEARPISSDKARAEDMLCVSSWVMSCKCGKGYEKLDAFSFQFTGVHGVFDLSDIPDLLLTRNGVAVDFKFRTPFVRNVEAGIVGVSFTYFDLYIIDQLTVPGNYSLTGTYMGKPFDIDFIICSD